MLRVLLIDDEETGLDILEILLSEFDRVEIVGRYTDPIEALEHLKSEKVDALFLDIEMAELSGMEVASRVREMNIETKIIFVTAHTDFAVEAFEIQSLDYLLKPITKARLQQSVERLVNTTGIQDRRDSSISIRCFGHFAVHCHEKNETIIWKTNKVNELCAFLVHCEGNLVEIDRILDILWPEVPVSKAKASLYTCISYLRGTFKEYGFENVILKKGSSYCILLSEFRCDLSEWMSHIQTVGDQANLNQLEKVLNIYTAEYMENGFNWAVEKREFIRKKMLTIYNQLANYYNNIDEFEKSLEFIEKEMECSPYSDEICQRLINSYLKMNNRAAALIVYQNYVQVLQEEIGLEPSRQMKMLLKIINDG